MNTFRENLPRLRRQYAALRTKKARTCFLERLTATLCMHALLDESGVVEASAVDVRGNTGENARPGDALTMRPVDDEVKNDGSVWL